MGTLHHLPLRREDVNREHPGLLERLERFGVDLLGEAGNRANEMMSERHWREMMQPGGRLLYLDSKRGSVKWER